MKVLCLPGIPYCFECGLYMSSDRDPIKATKEGFVVFRHVGNNHCENAGKSFKLPVTLIDVEEITNERE